MRTALTLALMLAGCAAPTGVEGVRRHFTMRPVDREGDSAALEAEGRWLDAGEQRFDAGSYLEAARDAWRWFERFPQVSGPNRERARRLYNHAVAAYVLESGASPRPGSGLRCAYTIHSRFSREFESKGGFGAPFVIQPDRPIEEFGEGLVTGAHGFVAARTAVLRFEWGRPRLSFHDPLREATVEFQGRRVPLTSDVMATLELRLTNPHVRQWENEAALRPGLTQAGFTLMEIPTSEKIPVVLLHGLKQDPTDFATMVAGLLQDPTIRTRYQFVAYRWSTGLPVPLSVGRFRKQMEDFWYWFEGRAPRARRRGYWMIGHSLGGILAKTEAVDSGNRIIDALFRVPRSELDLTSPMGRALKRAVIYTPDPRLAGVVFMAVPHRGSAIASGPIGSFARSLIRLTKGPTELQQEFAEHYGDQLKPEVLKLLRKKPTSVQNIKPDDPYLRALASCPFGPGIEIHSIIGALYGTAKNPIGDGAVSYESAHLDGATSETVLKAGHNLHKSKAALDVVKRILLAYLDAPATSGPRPPP